MGVISNWAGSRGLSLSEEFFSSLMGLRSFEAIVLEKLDLIDQKLDILIEAPFQQARMHLLEGNLDRCKDKLIEAISLNELDLPAITLYALLLYQSGKIPLSLEYFEQIIRKFGPHGSLLSNRVIEIYSEYVNEGKPLQAIASFNLQLESWIWYPLEIHCTLSSIIIKWQPMQGYSWEGAGMGGHHRKPRITIHNWQGGLVLDFETYSRVLPEILSVTEEYVVITIDTGLFFRKQEIKIFRTKDGSEVLTSKFNSPDQIAKLFLCDARFVGRTRSSSETLPLAVSFAGARVEIAAHNPYSIAPRQINIRTV